MIHLVLFNIFQNFQRYPFDSKTIIGFFVAFIMQSTVLWYVFTVVTVLVSFGINSFIFGISITTHLKIVLHHINANAKNKKNRLSAINELNNFIELQSEGNQLSFFCNYFLLQLLWINFLLLFRMIQQFSSMFQPIVAILFIWCIGEYLFIF